MITGEKSGVRLRRASTPALIGLICVLCCGCASAGEVATSPSIGTSSPVAASRSASASATSVDRLAVPGPTDKVSVSRVDLLRERLRLLDGYLEHWANDHFNHYPAASRVHEGGIPAAAWPNNPWTGEPMTPGKSMGDFTYKVSPDLLSCTLLARYPGGTVRIHSAVPRSRKLQNDHRSVEGGELILYFADLWSRRHGGELPTAAQMASDAAVGTQAGVSWWPHNPWTHEMMHQGTEWGDFTYEVDPRAGTFSIVVHFANGGSRTFRGPLSKASG